MAVPQRLTHRLQQTLGAEAAEDLVNLLSGLELQRNEWTAFRADMRAEFAEFRGEMRGEFAQLRAEMLSQQLEIQKQVSTFSASLEKVRADLLKWSFLFWTGAVASIALLAGVLRN